MLYVSMLYESYLYLQDGAGRLFQWFPENQMKGNTDKCHQR